MSKLAKSRLGRGLSSLISISDLPVEAEVAAPPPAQTPTVSATSELDLSDDVINRPPAVPAVPGDRQTTGNSREISLDQITPNPHQPRRKISEASIAELAASIKSTGLIQPIIVRQVPGGYQLIAGERRWRAARYAGLKQIPAVVRDVDSFTQAQMALVENVQREDLNPIDRAESYKALIAQLGLTQAELASRLGEDRSSIANFLRLLELAEPVRQLIRDGKLSTGHAKILAGVADILEQERLANVVVSQELSVRNLERMLQNEATAPETTARQAPVQSAHLSDLERTIARQIGMKVLIKSAAKKGKGRLVIHYANLDQFDELLSKLGVKVE